MQDFGLGDGGAGEGAEPLLLLLAVEAQGTS